MSNVAQRSRVAPCAARPAQPRSLVAAWTRFFQALQPKRALRSVVRLFCCNASTLVEACLRRQRLPHAVLVQEGSGRGAAVDRSGGAGGSGLRRDARALPCFASIRCTLALLAYTEGWWWGWAGAAHWFCHRRRAERDGALARELHDKHDMQST